MTKRELLPLFPHLSERTFRQQVRREKEDGALILSSCCGSDDMGYFLPSLDPEQARREMVAYYRSMMRRAKRTMAILRPVRIALKVVEGQTGPLDVEAV